MYIDVEYETASLDRITVVPMYQPRYPPSRHARYLSKVRTCLNVLTY